mgnify:CR=1 FL=1
MKNIRIVHGTLMYPLEVGSRALIFEEGRYLHTSTVIAIHGVTPQQIRFETMNSHYCLLAPSSPVAANVPVTVASLPDDWYSRQEGHPLNRRSRSL